MYRQQHPTTINLQEAARPLRDADRVVQHYCKVNNVTEKQFLSDLAAANRNHKRRSFKYWEIDFGVFAEHIEAVEFAQTCQRVMSSGLSLTSVEKKLRRRLANDPALRRYVQIASQPNKLAMALQKRR